MAALASVDDYKARYGEPADSARTDVLLQDASDLMLAAYEDRLGAYSVGVCPAFDRAAPAVCCLLVNRVLSAPSAMAGATQYSQGAGGYTASVTYGSALGEMYLGRSDLKRLGLTGQTLGALSPLARGGGAE
jgi:hypothetical protein|nr:MAG TPA: hypothetical protein [Caudoviricetes sp.]